MRSVAQMIPETQKYGGGKEGKQGGRQQYDARHTGADTDTDVVKRKRGPYKQGFFQREGYVKAFGMQAVPGNSQRFIQIIKAQGEQNDTACTGSRKVGQEGEEAAAQKQRKQSACKGDQADQQILQKGYMYLPDAIGHTNQKRINIY